ncbi:alanyl-tRNA editing protein [Acidobacteria bacterium ACD]|nr:MAG: alanyl-tRNA editing protein [Acidobacteriota bacterium]MDL1949351.1 alanyl-tRNA editing protein [Acidobacteria bacterium ACD]
MSPLPAYERDPYQHETLAQVVATGTEDGRPWAVLSDTILYPEGGGQPADRGRLGEVPVVDVQKRGGEVRHYLERPVGPGPVLVVLDWERRFDHMQQHTGQHLLTAVAADRFGWETTAFHLGVDVSDVELSVPALTPSQLEALEDAVAAEVRAARPVAARHVPLAEYSSLSVRSRGLPEGHEGDVRLVEIAGVDLNTCGGTHVRSTAELEVVKLLGTESLRGGTRLFFVVGGRARRRFGAHEARNAALRVVLGAPDAELPAAAEAKLARLQEAEKRVRALEEELAEATAASLAASPERLVARHLPDRAMDVLQRLARRLVALAPGKAFLLTSSCSAVPAGAGVFVLAAGEEVSLDLPALAKDVAAILGGRGGGSGRVFQGKAGELSRAGEAEALVLLRLGSGRGEGVRP